MNDYSMTIKKNFDVIICRLIAYGKLLEEQSAKSTIYFNVLDCLPMDENCNSSLLAALFKQNDNGRYQVLRDFVKSYVDEQLAEQISCPLIYTEEMVSSGKRIDIYVYEPNKYAIIFENKIMNAPEQPNQLANYIEGVRAKGFVDEQIYIVYMPRTNNEGPTSVSWTNKRGFSYKSLYSCRYVKVSFEKGILPWLAKIQKEMLTEQGVWKESIKVFEDYLKGMFGMRNSDIMQEMEIKRFIYESFHLTNNNESDAAELIEQMKLMDDLKKRMQMEKRKMMLSVFQKWHERLREDFPTMKIEYQISDTRFMNIGVLVPYNETTSRICIKLEFDNTTNNLYFGFKYAEGFANRREEMREWLVNHPSLIQGIPQGVDWMFFKNVSIEKGYDDLTDLIHQYFEVVGKK